MDKERLKDLETPLLEDGPGSLNQQKDSSKGKNPPPPPPSIFTEE